MKIYIKPKTSFIEIDNSDSIFCCSSSNPSGHWEDTHHGKDEQNNGYWSGGWGQSNPASEYRKTIWDD